MASATDQRIIKFVQELLLDEEDRHRSRPP